MKRILCFFIVIAMMFMAACGEIILPDSIKVIGGSCFSCLDVTSIYVPKGVEEISESFNTIDLYGYKYCDVVYGGSLKEWIGLGMTDGGEGWTLTCEN